MLHHPGKIVSTNIIDVILQKDNDKFREILKVKLNDIIHDQLAEMRCNIIEREFAFLNEKTIQHHYHKAITLKVPTQRKITPAPETKALKAGFRTQGNKVVRMKSLEKFHRMQGKKKQSANRMRHVAIAIRKRQKYIQNQKALGIPRHQKAKALGTIGKH